MVNCCENAAYYNTTPSLSIKEWKKNINNAKENWAYPHLASFISVSSQTSNIESHASKA